MLQMDDVIAFLQLGKVNVQYRTSRLRVGRLQSARALNFVAAEDLRVRDDDQFPFFINKTASQRAEVG